MSDLYSLKVVSITSETKDSKSIELEIPSNLKNIFSYKPGQYLTLQFELRGDTVRRAYSLCSSPSSDKTLKVGVKRVKNGLVSNHINSAIKVGDSIDVLPPMGDFYVDIDSENYKSYYLFAAGSGITPILSILKTILIQEKESHVYMLYGNTNQTTAMFFDELKEIQNTYKERFNLVNTYSKPKKSLSGLFKSKNKDHKTGRINGDQVKSFIQENQPYAQNTEYYVCGPQEMIEGTVNALKSIDVPEDRIKREYFGTGTTTSSNEGVKEAKLKATVEEDVYELTIPKSTTILRTLINNKIEVPYSCEGGVCGMCRCQLVSGEVTMGNNLALSKEEVDNGQILACQSIPTTENIEIFVEEYM